jgi:hypothetical protein
MYCPQPETFHVLNLTRLYHIPFRIKQIYGTLTCRGGTGSTVIYIHTEGVGKILTNIFETNYCK